MRRILVLRHGILINRYYLVPMERYFRRAGYDVHNRSYPSTRKTIQEHAADLAAELLEIHRSLEERGEPHEIHAIAHSLAGLVLRYALTHLEVPPVRRAVLLMTPNRGAFAARWWWGGAPFRLVAPLRWLRPYRWLYGGKAGRQLAEEPPGIFEEAGIPRETEIGVIAGDAAPGLLRTPIETPNDRRVAVSEAALPPFPLKVLPYGHTQILFVRYAWEEARHFLEHGAFRQGP